MGLFSKKKSYPKLDVDSTAAQQINDVSEPLKNLMGKISDPLEVVPDEKQTFVFIGKPPKKFGVATIENDEVQSFVAAAQEKGLDQLTIQKINEKFRDAYIDHQDAERYSMEVAGKEVVVTPSKELAQDVQEIINSV